MIVEVLIPHLMVARDVRNADLWAANGIPEWDFLLWALPSLLCCAHGVGYWWMASWLIWGDLWRHLLHKAPFYPSRVRPSAADSLIAASQGKQKAQTWGMLGKVLIFVSFFIFPKHSAFDNVPMIALWMPNYSVITWGFVILFRVAKSEFNISRCCFSFLVVFFLLLWQCFLDFWLKKLNFESIHIHASFRCRPQCNYNAEQRWRGICARTPFPKK